MKALQTSPVMEEPAMNCTRCRAEILPGAHFCTACGLRVPNSLPGETFQPSIPDANAPIPPVADFSSPHQPQGVIPTSLDGGPSQVAGAPPLIDQPLPQEAPSAFAPDFVQPAPIVIPPLVGP